MIFVDTGVWYSLLVSKDPNHTKSSAWFANLSEQIVTSDYVVDETLTLLLMRGERSKAINFGKLVIEGSTSILHFVSKDQFNRSWILFQRLSLAGLSFTDCTSHVVALDLGITKVAAYDQHFQTNGKFSLLPMG